VLHDRPSVWETQYPVLASWELDAWLIRSQTIILHLLEGFYRLFLTYCRGDSPVDEILKS
jgi:hypothetical protein